MNASAMKLGRSAFLAMGLIALASSCTAAADPETEQLRAENLLLKAQLRALQQSCPVAQAAPAGTAAPVAAARAPTASVAVVTPPVADAPPATIPVPVTPSTPAPPSAAAATSATPVAAAAPAAVVPKGYKLVPVNAPDYVDPLAPPYDRTGCSRDLFSGPPPAKWTDASNWSGLRRGLTPAKVEELLGREHFDASGHGRTEWQFGKCGDSVAGRVQFQDSQVVFWQTPDL